VSSRHPPLTARDVIKGLKNLGFTPRKPTSGTSHVNWAKIVDGKIYKVTVDASKEPFSHDLIKSMASQAGVSKDKFYQACLNKK